MSIRIVSDGTPGGTSVQNDFGMPISGISKITWSIDVETSLATATIEFTNVSIDAIAEIKE